MQDDVFFSAAGLSAPHPLAAAAGRDVLIEGGGVIEAALAAAAVAAVVVPDRNGLGGDALWLIREPGPRGRTRVLDARGTVGGAARLSFYRERDRAAVPLHGPEAVAAVPGAVAGWIEAHGLAMAGGGRMPMARLLAPALAAARDGWDLGPRDIAALDGAALDGAAPGLAGRPGFAAAHLVEGRAPEAGTRRRDATLAATLQHLVDGGLADLYSGDVARELAVDLEAMGSPLGRADLRATEARWRDPHALDLGRHTLTVPPTRAGLLAAVALGLADGLGAAGFDMAAADGVARWHGAIEAARAAEALVDAMEADGGDPAALLDGARLARFCLTLDRERASRAEPRSAPLLAEASVWIGAVDRDGAAVSLVQTLGGAFGSGMVSGRTGILLGNRAAALAVDPDLGPVLRPGRRPPLRALPALLANPRDGRVAALGAGGEAGAVTVAQLADRLMRGMGPTEAVAAQRFALGATPDGRDGAVLVDGDREPGPVAKLRSAGHQVVDGDGSRTGAAGTVVRLATGRIVAASDDGEAAGL